MNWDLEEMVGVGSMIAIMLPIAHYLFELLPFRQRAIQKKKQAEHEFLSRMRAIEEEIQSIRDWKMLTHLQIAKTHLWQSPVKNSSGLGTHWICGRCGVCVYAPNGDPNDGYIPALFETCEERVVKDIMDR